MDRFEDAIDLLESLRNEGDYELCDPPVWTNKERDAYHAKRDALTLAIAALREKQQREKEAGRE